MNLGSEVPGLPVDPDCGCATCIEAVKRAELDASGDPLRYLSRYMVLCPTCGNKRCPKATHHGYDCSGSNTPGQAGSWYALPGAAVGAVSGRVEEQGAQQ